MARIVDFADGAQSETTPTIGNIIASGIITYPDDATYEATEQGAPIDGNIYYNTTLDVLRYYSNGAWSSIIDDDSLQTIINKTIDADNNTITNIENDNIKAGAAIDATKLHDGSVDNTEFGHLDGVTSNIQTQLDAKQNTSEKGIANGYPSLDGSGLVPASQLPSYVDDVEEYADFASLPATGETGKIYVTLDTSGTFRWTGATYVGVGNGNAWADPVDADILPDLDSTRTIGSPSLRFTNVHADNLSAEDSRINSGINSDSQSGVVFSTNAASGQPPITMQSAESSVADGNATGDTYVMSGNKTAGSGDSGDVILQTGSSSGGSRGSIKLKNGSEGTAGQFWQSTGTDGEGQWAAAPDALGGINSVQVFTSSGTWTKPAGVNTIVVEVVGGGGASGGPQATGAGEMSMAAGGGGGGYSKKFIDVSAIASETVTVGAGGSGSSGAGGGAGGTSSFGAHCSATGGAGGNTVTPTTGTRALKGADGGIGSGGDINVKGEGSGPAWGDGGLMAFGSSGGSSHLGGGGAGTARNATADDGIAGGTYGGGGGGGANWENRLARTGSAGADGVVIVWEYK